MGTGYIHYYTQYNAVYQGRKEGGGWRKKKTLPLLEQVSPFQLILFFSQNILSSRIAILLRRS